MGLLHEDGDGVAVADASRSKLPGGNVAVVPSAKVATTKYSVSVPSAHVPDGGGCGVGGFGHGPNIARSNTPGRDFG